MGKGRGRGRGKGGCECCEAIHALACCLCLVLFGGPILIAVGATLIASANRNDRARGIGSVQAAVDSWNDASSPNGWAQFQRVVAYARWMPTQQTSIPACALNATEGRLLPNLTQGDRYWDEEGRFGGVKQAKLTAYVDYISFATCFMAVNLTQQLAGGSGNASLVHIPPMLVRTLDYSILLDKAGGPRNCATRNDGCGTVNAANCRSNCENYFQGRWDCNGGNYRCYVSGSYFSNFAVKVSYQDRNGTAPAGYYLDTSYPRPGGGANVLPAGYMRDYATSALPATVPPGPLFQLPNIVPRIQPLLFSVSLRASADPWLTYMAVTDGTGYFGATKGSLMAAGVTLVVVGCLGTLFWLVAAFYTWWMLCSRRKPTSRPSGVSGVAWDLANRYGGQYAPALGVPVHATGHDGLPTAQPLYVAPGAYPNQQVPGQPVAGYPYPYPPPYGAPQPGPYPPYPYPPYPPPGGAVEMNQYPAGGHPPPYGYPPAPPAGGTPDGQAATTPPPAQYVYPYAYPYPPYMGAPPAAGGAPPPQPPPPPPSGPDAAAPPTGPANGARS